MRFAVNGMTCDKVSTIKPRISQTAVTYESYDVINSLKRIMLLFVK